MIDSHSDEGAMNDGSSNAMIIDTDHLRSVTMRNVHLGRWGNDADHIESVVREAATVLNYHVALLDGRSIHSEETVLLALADACYFPSGMREAALSNWNVANDLLGDSTWLFAAPSMKKGIVAFLRDPEFFMRENLLQFAFLIESLAVRSQWILRQAIPFHIVVGPLPEDSRYECFLNLLTVSKHFCCGCQMVG